jgi:hypothetical protein
VKEKLMARLFEVLENPQPGWTTRKIESHRTVDSEPEWHVELIRESDGATINFHHESLHVAWVRACEHAHASDIKLDQDEEQVRS